METERKIQHNETLRKMLYVVIPLFVLLVAWFGWKVKETYFPPKAVHYHAGFVVFKDNKQFDFSTVKYMHAKPCGNEEHEEHSPEEEQIEKAHLHDYIGDVVHTHREGALWKDLFINLKYPIDNAQGYINGKKVDDFQNQPIKPYDSLVVFIGKNDIEKQLAKAVTKKHIQTVEKKSDNCGVK